MNDPYEKISAVLKGTFFTLGLMTVMVGYTLVWAFLFYFTIADVSTDLIACKKIIQWNKSLYILYFISSVVNTISSFIQIILNSLNLESNIPNYISGFRSCSVFICGITILCGITDSYISSKNILGKCDRLLGLNLSYIVTEWVIIGIFVIFVTLFCFIHFVIRKTRGRDKEVKKNTDISNFEDDGYVEVEEVTNSKDVI